MYTNDDLKKLSDEEKKKQRHAIQMQMVILDSDSRKLLAEKSELEAGIRKIRMDQERLRIELEEKEKRFKSVSDKIVQSEAEIKRLKGKLNVL